MTCIFCHQLNENAILYQTKHFKVVWDILTLSKLDIY